MFLVHNHKRKSTIPNSEILSTYMGVKLILARGFHLHLYALHPKLSIFGAHEDVTSTCR